jgi:hypothetical protein
LWIIIEPPKAVQQHGYHQSQSIIDPAYQINQKVSTDRRQLYRHKFPTIVHTKSNAFTERDRAPANSADQFTAPQSRSCGHRANGRTRPDAHDAVSYADVVRTLSRRAGQTGVREAGRRELASTATTRAAQPSEIPKIVL